MSKVKRAMISAVSAEVLECRRLLAGFATLNSAGTLSIVGSPASETIDVKLAGGRIVATRGQSIASFSPSAVKRLFIAGGGGNDSLANNTAKPATLNGEAGDDTLRGGTSADTINGGRGADQLFPGDGGNTIITDNADFTSYANLTGQRFDIFVTAPTAREAAGTIQHGKNIDLFVCIDAAKLDLALTAGNDALDVYVDGEFSVFQPPPVVQTRIDMAGGNDQLIRGFDPGKSTTILGSGGNDQFLSSDEFTAPALRDAGSGDDYIQWSPYTARDIIAGDGFDTIDLIYDTTETGHPSIDVNDEGERFLIDRIPELIFGGDASSVFDGSRGTRSRIDFADEGNDTIIGANGEGGPGDDVFLLRDGQFQEVFGGEGFDRADADANDSLTDIESVGPISTALIPWSDMPAIVTPPRLTAESVPSALLTTSGTVLLAGSSSADSLAITLSGGNVFANRGSQKTTYARNDVRRIIAFGGDGNDVIDNRTSLPATLYGDGGNDTIVDGTANDTLIAGSGADRLEVRGGNNSLAWSGSDDEIDYRRVAQHDFDIYFSASPYGDYGEVAHAEQADRLSVSQGSFNLRLTDAADQTRLVTYGGEGSGFVTGSIQAGGGNDLFTDSNLEFGSVELRGGDGNDQFAVTVGNGGALRMFGDNGNDEFLASDSEETGIAGGRGIDREVLFVFEEGRLELDADVEIFSIQLSTSGVTISDSERGHVIDAGGNVLSLTVLGNGGNDTIIGGNGSDSLDGGGGNDRIEGRGFDDTIVGGSGRDFLHGGSGDDSFLAADGERDFIDGGDGDDNAQSDLIDDLFNVESLIP